MFPLTQKIGNPSRNLLMVNFFQKFDPPDFKFYPSKLTNKNVSLYGIMLKFAVFYCSIAVET